jgi:hypothetical protein
MADGGEVRDDLLPFPGELQSQSGRIRQKRA